MDALMMAILIWLMLLTIAMVGIAVVGLSARRELKQRHEQLDIHAGLQDLTRQLQRINLGEHEQLRTNVQLFIDRCKKDPITAERRHLDIIELESILHHGRR